MRGCGGRLYGVSFGLWDVLGSEERSKKVHRRQTQLCLFDVGMGKAVLCGTFNIVDFLLLR